MYYIKHMYVVQMCTDPILPVVSLCGCWWNKIGTSSPLSVFTPICHVHGPGQERHQTPGSGEKKQWTTRRLNDEMVQKKPLKVEKIEVDLQIFRRARKCQEMSKSLRGIERIDFANAIIFCISIKESCASLSQVDVTRLNSN